MKVHLRHFLLFAPLVKLSEQLVRGLYFHFPDLSLRREEGLSDFLAAIAARRWDLIFVVSPVPPTFWESLSQHITSLGIETPIIHFTPSDVASTPPVHVENRPPNVITVQAERIDLFLNLLRRVIAESEEGRSLSIYELLDYLDDGLFVLDTSGHIAYVNTALATMCDTVPTALLGRKADTFIPARLLDRARAIFKQAVEGRRVWSVVEVPELDPPRIVRIELFPLQRNGALVAVGGLLRDITYQEEKRRREGQERQRREAQSTALASLSTCPELLKGDWAKAAELLLRVTAQTLHVAEGSFWRLVERREEEVHFQCEVAYGTEACADALWHLPSHHEWWLRLQQGRLIILEGCADDLKEIERAGFPFQGYRAVLLAPLLVHQELLGVVIYPQRSRRFWFADEIAFVERTVTYFSQAYLTYSLQRRNRLLDTMTRMSREIMQSHDLDETIEVIARTVHQLIPAEAVIVCAIDVAHRVHITPIGATSVVDERIVNWLTQGRDTEDFCVEYRWTAHAWEEQEEENPLIPLFAQKGWCSLFVMPICAEKERVGYIILASHHPRRFAEDERLALRAVAEQCGHAVDRIRILEGERRQRRWMEGLYLAGRALERAQTIVDILDGIRDAATLLDIDLIGILEIHHIVQEKQRRRVITLTTTYRVAEEWQHDHYTSPFCSDLMLGKIEGAELVIGHYHRLIIPSHNNLSGIVQALGGHSELLLTEIRRRQGGTSHFILGGKIVAEAGQMDADENRFLNMLADIVAVAYERLNFLLTLQGERERLGILHRLSQHLLESLDPRDVAQRALEELCASTGATQGLVQLLYSDLTYGELLATCGFSEEQVENLRSLLHPSETEELTRWVMEHRESVILADASKDTRWRVIPGVDDHVHSVISVPLLGKEGVLGALNLYSEEVNFFDETHLQLVESAASTIAVALHNAQLFHREQERRRFVEALEEAVAIVNSDLEFDEMMDRILEQVERVVGGDTFNLMLLQKQEVRIVRWRGYEKLLGDIEVDTRPFPLHRFPSLVAMVEKGHSICIPDTRHARHWVVSKGAQWHRSYIGAPVRIADVTVGFLNAHSAQPGYFTEEHARRLEAFAEHAAIAIRNARLYRTLQEYAGQLEHRVEQRTAELLAQYARLNAVLNSTTNGIVVTDAEGTVIQANPVATRWLTQYFAPHEVHLLRRKIKEMALRARQRPEEVVELGPVALHLRASPVRGSEESTAIGHVVIAIDDISQLKALERMKSRFISNISHELRTPLTAIKLYAQLLRRKCAAAGVQEGEIDEYLDAMEREIAHQGALVEEVLNFSRIQAGETPLTLRRVDLVKVVHKVWRELETMAKARGLDFRFEAESAIHCVVDVTKIERAVRNLLVNAIRYTDEGGQVKVSVQRCLFLDGRTGACIRVEDTGIGIPQHEIEHIFDRFYRGEEVQQRQIPGTGLGLAIVKEIARLHGGIVTVHSKLGQGTAFTLRLPIRQIPQR